MSKSRPEIVSPYWPFIIPSYYALHDRLIRPDYVIKKLSNYGHPDVLRVLSLQSQEEYPQSDPLSKNVLL